VVTTPSDESLPGEGAASRAEGTPAGEAFAAVQAAPPPAEEPTERHASWLEHPGRRASRC
jgi:hypothetical protein